MVTPLLIACAQPENNVKSGYFGDYGESVDTSFSACQGLGVALTADEYSCPNDDGCESTVGNTLDRIVGMITDSLTAGQALDALDCKVESTIPAEYTQDQYWVSTGVDETYTFGDASHFAIFPGDKRAELEPYLDSVNLDYGKGLASISSGFFLFVSANAYSAYGDYDTEHAEYEDYDSENLPGSISLEAFGDNDDYAKISIVVQEDDELTFFITDSESDPSEQEMPFDTSTTDADDLDRAAESVRRSITNTRLYASGVAGVTGGDPYFTDDQTGAETYVGMVYNSGK